ncbi:hypothetical protein D3C87_1976750 [compost metagenome]
MWVVEVEEEVREGVELWYTETHVDQLCVVVDGLTVIPTHPRGLTVQARYHQVSITSKLRRRVNREVAP